MALSRAAYAIQQAVLANVRLVPAATQVIESPSLFQRFYAGGYLDRNKVTERIIGSLKHCDKVDPNQVPYPGCC
jgi:hypothetical protein